MRVTNVNTHIKAVEKKAKKTSTKSLRHEKCKTKNRHASKQKQIIIKINNCGFCVTAAEQH